MTKKVNILTELGADIQNVNVAISRKLKSLRQSRGLTLEQLSRRSGVSKGMLVEIEKGNANPSIAILCKTAGTLGVSVADIVDVAEESAMRLVSPEEAKTLWQGKKGGVAKLLAGTTGPDMIEMWHWIMQPGESFQSTGHRPNTVELIHVEKGVLTLTLADAESEIPAKSSVVACTDTSHSYANRQKAELRFYMTVVEVNRRTDTHRP